MGKGLALAFKHRFPDMFTDYLVKCEKGQVTVTTPYLWDNGKVQIQNFATKKHWKDNSNLVDIKSGLLYLAQNYDEMGISSIALPPLGCRLGGLKWSDVKALIDQILGPIHDLDVFVCEPSIAQSKDLSDDDLASSGAQSINGLAAQGTQQSLF